MAQRGRGYSQGHDWDPMREDFDNSNYDPQYPDDDASDFVQLDHCRLYITNIPKGLNDEGLRAAFAKYGTLSEVYVSRDPNKRYGLVSYETAGEAKLAMMKLNRTEPLKLNISVAHKKKIGDGKKGRGRRDRDDNNSNDTRERASHREDNASNCPRRERDDASVTSKGRNTRREDLANGDNNVAMEDLPVDVSDELGLESLDPELQLELDRLQLEHLKLQQAQLLCKKRMLLKQAERRATSASLTQSTPSNRCVLPGGRVVVRNVAEGSLDPGEGFSAGAGDSCKLPALQRAASRACVACGAVSDMFCSRCGVTPYCSLVCQRRDWADRHRAVCHNLARLAGVTDVNDTEDIEAGVPPAAPLRRPRSPVAKEITRNKEPNVVEKENREDQMQKRLSPAGGNLANQKRPTSSSRGRNFKPSDGRRPPLRHELNRNNDEDENWNCKAPASQPEASASLKQQPMARRDPPVASPVKQATPALPKEPPVVTKPESPAKQDIPAKSPVKPPGSISDVTPVRKLVPKSCLIETLSVGDVVMLSVDNTGKECRTSSGFVCLALHEKYEGDFQALCEEYGAECEADTAPYTVCPGETFSLYCEEDGAWYRARCLSSSRAALLDSSRVLPLAPGSKCRRLPATYENTPEFSCLLHADVKVGDSLKATLVAKTPLGYKVTLENVETSAAAGEGDLTRWLPEVEHPAPKVLTPAGPAVIPEVARPDVVDKSKVLLVDVTALDKAFVRPADTASQKDFDGVLEEVVLYGRTATPLKEPPQKGQMVVGRFTDGLHYRALVKRTNVKQDKYLLEYVEFGNTEICKLADLYPCPKELELTSRSTVTSQVTLHTQAQHVLAEPATQYLDKLKDTSEELLLTLPSGAKTAPSGSAVVLTVVKNKEVVNKKVEQLCTPDWKKIEERGGDVIETEVMMFGELEYLELPGGEFVLDVLDISTLHTGAVGGCERGLPYARRVLAELTEKMAEYCKSDIGKEPYLPKAEELCIAQCPPYPQWFRAVFFEQLAGPGGAEAQVCYIDYGNMETVPVHLLRKMLPEFVRGLPALSNTILINDFPKNPTPAMLAKAVEFMQINDDGRGVLPIAKCYKDEEGMYYADAPELIAVMLAAQ